MKIICIGRNYVDHAKELKNPLPKEPVFFLKPDTCIIRNNKPFFLPDFSNDMQHELEIVLKICRVGKNIESRFAHRYYKEIGLGIDFTARDIQARQKEKGLPWEIAKAFDGAAPISKFLSRDKFSDVNNLSFHLDVNGKTVQRGNTANMIFSFDHLIAHVSRFMTLKMGDFLFTGTPAGVGKVNIDDKLEGYLEDQKLLDFNVK
jgi:2-keto-4-pentenoate hydratase/2-oxohepta-3-ene-1,7-dioic acid hydratase in catechol pathway